MPVEPDVPSVIGPCGGPVVLSYPRDGYTLAAIVVRRRPRVLVVCAWAWRCAHTDDLDEKQRCLKAILELDPELEWAQLALQQVRERQVQMN